RDEIPGELASVAAEIREHPPALLIAQRRQPFEGGVVVVRARVDERAFGNPGWMVLALGMSDAELEHTHAWQPQGVAERANLVRDVAEILRNDGKAAQGFMERPEQPHARPRFPVPTARIGCARGDGPVGLEAAEVVQAEEIDALEIGPDAPDPPAEAVRLDAVPVVEGRAPALPRLAEVVGRHARHGAGLSGFVELKGLAPRPHVGAVVRDVDRRVAEEPDAPRERLPAHSLPLSLEEELEELLVGDFLADLALDASEGSGIAIAKACVPGGPRGAAMEELERGESR